MFAQSPADELAEIRAEIARLRAREGELRAAYLSNAALPRVGRWHRVDLLTHRQRIFEPRLLPEDIRLDPAFTREKVTRVLRASRRLDLAPPEAGADAQPARPATPRKRLFATFTAH